MTNAAMDDFFTRGRFALPINHLVVAKAWREHGCSCHAFHDPKGQEWHDIQRGCNERLTVVEGQLEIRIGDNSQMIEPGDEMLIPERTTHSIINAHDGPTIWLFGYD